jgi:hypothetical protein
MRFAKLAAAAAVLSMASAPAVAAVAQPTSASKLSLSNAQPVRAATGLKQSSKAAPVVIILAVIAIGFGVYFAVDGGGDSDSN